MSNPSGPPGRGGLPPRDASEDSTAIRPAVRLDDERPTLAQRIMQSRGQDGDGSIGNGVSGNGVSGNGHNGSHGNGANGSSPARAAHGANGSAAPTARRAEQPGASRPSPGAPNTGQPFRNGTPRPVTPPPATYSPVPGAAAGPAPQGAPTPPRAKKKADPFSTWRKPDDAASSAPTPVARQDPPRQDPSRRDPSRQDPSRQAPPRQEPPPETLTTGAAGTVTTGQAAQSVPQPAAKASATSATSASSKSDKLIVRRTRKARLRLSRIDPWSVMKTAFMFSIAAGIVLFVAVYSLWSVIQASDMFPAINQIVQDAIGTQGDTTPFQIEAYVNTSKVLGATALIAVVDVLLITALATLVAFLYNLSSSVLGGLEVTLAED